MPFSRPKFTAVGATCRPCGAKKAQNWPLYRRFVLRAMLPVTSIIYYGHLPFDKFGT